MGNETCPSCGGRQLRFSVRLSRHYLRSFIGSRKRFCVACHARWTSSTRGAWPLAARGAITAAAILGLRAADHYYHAPKLEHAPLYVRPKAPAPAAGSDADAGKGGEDDPALALPEGPPGVQTTADWLRAHQNDAAFAGASSAAARLAAPDKPRGIFATLGTLSKMLKLSLGMGRGGMSKAQMDSLLKQDKKQLWNQYGKYFSSKEEAKKAYEQAQKESKSGN